MDEMAIAESKPRKKPWGLREHDAEIERLRYQERLTLQAIADRFGCSKQAVSGALARQAMKKALAAATGEGSTTDTEGSASATIPNDSTAGPLAHPGANPETQEV